MIRRLMFYIVATSYLRRGRRDEKLHDEDVLMRLFAEWIQTCLPMYMYLLSEMKNNE